MAISQYSSSFINLHCKHSYESDQLLISITVKNNCCFCYNKPCAFKSILLLFMSKYDMHFYLTVTLNAFIRETTSAEIYYGFHRAVNQIWHLKHLHIRIRFFVSSIRIRKKYYSFLVTLTFICKNDMKFEEKLNVISKELRNRE